MLGFFFREFGVYISVMFDKVIRVINNIFFMYSCI